jgi:hypothetical protein
MYPAAMSGMALHHKAHHEAEAAAGPVVSDFSGISLAAGSYAIPRLPGPSRLHQ